MSVEFKAESFAQGGSRQAHMGTYTAPSSKQGKQCVVKKNISGEPIDCSFKRLQDECKKLAEKFNSRHNDILHSKTIKFVDVICMTVNVNECVLVEDYISGKFEKFSDNCGYISSKDDLMAAFMHWSWVHTKGEMMIADLQGVRNDQTYQLTDPAMLSNTTGGKYGCTDTGVKGIAMFFLNHTCNQFCKGLNKPTIEDVLGEGKRAAVAHPLIKKIRTSAAYRREWKFIPYIMQKMISIFPQVATSAPPSTPRPPYPLFLPVIPSFCTWRHAAHMEAARLQATQFSWPPLSLPFLDGPSMRRAQRAHPYFTLDQVRFNRHI